MGTFNNFMMISVFMLLFVLLGSTSPGAEATEEGKWDKAGKEMKEAADAVVEASRDSTREAWQTTKEESGDLYENAGEESAEMWEKTKEKSGEVWETIKVESFEAWEKAREESERIYDKAKAKIHEATAPDPGEGSPKPDPVE